MSNVYSSPPRTKRRKLPKFEDVKDETLANRAAQSVCEQYIFKFPEQVGALAVQHGRETVNAVAKSLHSATGGDAISSLTQSMQSRRDQGHVLDPWDTISVVSVDFNPNLTRDALLHEVVQVSHINEHVVSVFEEWLRHHYSRTRVDSLGPDEIENNGSALLIEDDSMSTLEDYIQRVAKDVSGQDEDGRVVQDNVDSIERMVEEFLDDPGADHLVRLPDDPVQIYQRVPKITIRYVRGAV